MLYKFLLPILSDRLVGKMYQKYGTQFGDAVSMLYVGECAGFNRMFSKWQTLEVEYLKRGLRSLPIDDFVSAGGYGNDIDSLIMVRRDRGENPVFHATIYKERYLGKTDRLIHLEKVMGGEMQYGTWHRPSTVDAIVHTP